MTGFDSKRQAAQAKLDDDDDTQVYADTLLIVYQRGFADGKAAANAMHELARLGQEIEQEQAEPCIGKDPRCPCQDGDACHYKDCVGTMALPVAQPAQRPWVRLEPEEVLDLFDVNNVYGSKWVEFARTVEAKLRSKNGY